MPTFTDEQVEAITKQFADKINKEATDAQALIYEIQDMAAQLTQKCLELIQDTAFIRGFAVHIKSAQDMD